MTDFIQFTWNSLCSFYSLVGGGVVNEARDRPRLRYAYLTGDTVGPIRWVGGHGDIDLTTLQLEAISGPPDPGFRETPLGVAGCSVFSKIDLGRPERCCV